MHGTSNLNYVLAGIAERAKALQEIRDACADGPTLPEFANFPSTPFQQYCEVLRSLPVQAEDNAEHKLRNAVLEALIRLPLTEAFKQHSQELFELCLAVVQHDNQENAVLSIKIMFELIKTYKGQMEPQAAQFLELILQVKGQVLVMSRQACSSRPSTLCILTACSNVQMCLLMSRTCSCSALLTVLSRVVHTCCTAHTADHPHYATYAGVQAGTRHHPYRARGPLARQPATAVCQGWTHLHSRDEVLQSSH